MTKFFPPYQLLSDYATNFTEKQLQELCDNFHSQKVFTTPHFKNIIEKPTKAVGSNWYKKLAYADYSYNNRVQSNTTTPFYQIYPFDLETRCSVSN